MIDNNPPNGMKLGTWKKKLRRHRVATMVNHWRDVEAMCRSNADRLEELNRMDEIRTAEMARMSMRGVARLKQTLERMLTHLARYNLGRRTKSVHQISSHGARLP